MAQAGWVKKTQNPHEKVHALRKFFEVVRLKDVPKFFPNVPAQSSDDNGEEYYECLAKEQERRRELRFGDLQPMQ